MYTLELVVNLDFIPEGWAYELVLYDKHGRLLEIGKQNNVGERSIRLPAWCIKDSGCILKVRMTDESGQVREEEYQLDFRRGNSQSRAFPSNIEEKLREKEQGDALLEQRRKQKYWKYEKYYTKQMEIPCKPPLEFRA